MSYRIICFTKILTLAIAPFLFILVGVVCEFAIVPGVYILLSPQEEGYRKTNSAAHLSKIGLLLNWKKNTKKEFRCVMMFVKRPRDTLKFQFIFDFIEYL